MEDLELYLRKRIIAAILILNLFRLYSTNDPITIGSYKQFVWVDERCSRGCNNNNSNSNNNNNSNSNNNNNSSNNNQTCYFILYVT